MGDYLLYEDAPVRSLKPGYGGGVYGITADSQGAMFDASGESDLIDSLQGVVEVDTATAGDLGKYRPFENKASQNTIGPCRLMSVLIKRGYY